MVADNSGLYFANVAYSYRNSKIPYSSMDCQAFAEHVLQEATGIKRDWRGSNHMWRDALSWKGTPEECIEKFGSIPAGAWLFTLKFDGGEVQRGYHDSEGNAAHVGIYTGQGKGAMHSTTGGVQECAYPDPARWNRIGLCKYLNYDTGNASACEKAIDDIISRLNELKSMISE